MGKIVMDTDKVKEACGDLKDAANKYNEVIDDIYKKMANISNDGVWISANANGSANAFIAGVLKDKASSEEIGDKMKTISEKVDSYASGLKKDADSGVQEVICQR